MDVLSQENNDTTIGNLNTFTLNDRVSRAPRSESDAIVGQTPWADAIQELEEFKTPNVGTIPNTQREVRC